MHRLAVCIATFRRVHLLQGLLLDLVQQTVQPDCLIVVDGDPSTGDVPNMLQSLSLPTPWQVLYVPSNHGNLAYQRYLGWRLAQKHRVLLYFDDDLRIPLPDTVEKIVAPLYSDEQPDVVGVTAPSVTGDISCFAETEALQRRSDGVTKLASRLGSARDLHPGALSPTGNRILPEAGDTRYSEVEWMYGRVMAYDLESLTKDYFSPDLFAMYELRLGKAEDTFLSHMVTSRGRVLLATCTTVEHPDADVPKAYPYKARALAYAIAFSRRFLNDHYRVTEPPHFSDRVALIKSYAGNTILNWWRAFTSFKAYRFAYAWGYTLGALRGLTQRPTAQNLTPNIDWWADAEAALANVQIVQSGANRG